MSFQEAREVLFHQRKAGWLGILLQVVAVLLLTLLLIPLVSGGLGILFLTALVGAIGGIWFIFKPHWGILLISSLMFVGIDAFFGATYLIAAAIMIPFAWSVIRDRGCWIFRVPQVQILLIIGFFLVISTIWSEFKYPVTLFPEKDQTIKQTREFITQFGWLVFFLYFINSRRLLDLTAKLYVVLISAAAFNGLFSFLVTGGADRAAAAFSMAKNSNRLAFISLFATSLVWFYRCYGPNTVFRIVTVPLLFGLPLAALASGSRGGLLQLIALTGLVIKDQKGWSPAKRLSFFAVIGFVGVLAFAMVPASYIERATTFDTDADAPGQESLQNRVRVVEGALGMILSDPVMGVGFGNYPWIARVFVGISGATHNSYLWAFLSGGIGVLALYLLLYYVTYRMLKRLEQFGPPELLWLVKATKVNVILFLICSISTDFWLSDFMYLIIGLTVAMTYLRNHQQEASRSPANVVVLTGMGRVAVAPRL